MHHYVQTLEYYYRVPYMGTSRVVIFLTLLVCSWLCSTGSWEKSLRHRVTDVGFRSDGKGDREEGREGRRLQIGGHPTRLRFRREVSNWRIHVT